MNRTFKLLNQYEDVTYHRLKAVTDGANAHVFAKVRVADSIPINDSGATTEEFSFALKAHFDFLVTSAEKIPLFAVEFDGPSHSSSAQIRRDQLKDMLAERFDLPLLRINSNYLTKKYRSYDLLTYFVEVWFLYEVFNQAQQSGGIPYDEPFDPCRIFDLSKNRTWPYWLSFDAQNKIAKLFDAEQVSSQGANHWAGLDARNRIHCLMWIGLTSGEVCYIETGMRSQSFPVSCEDILQHVATIDLLDKLNNIITGKCKPDDWKTLDAKVNDYQNRFKPLGCATWGTSVDLPPSYNHI